MKRLLQFYIIFMCFTELETLKSHQNFELQKIEMCDEIYPIKATENKKLIGLSLINKKVLLIKLILESEFIKVSKLSISLKSS